MAWLEKKTPKSEPAPLTPSAQSCRIRPPSTGRSNFSSGDFGTPAHLADEGFASTSVRATHDSLRLARAHADAGLAEQRGAEL